MNWGFHFLGALFVLFPGFVAYVAFAAASRHSHLSITERPNSLASAMLVLFGALFAHTCASFAFWFQEWCANLGWFPFLQIGFDPNPYKAFFRGSEQFQAANQNVAGFVAFTLFSSLALGFLTGKAAYRAGCSDILRNFVRPDFVGWALDLADKVAGPDEVVTAYILSKIQNGQYCAGYEGMVEKLSLGANGEIRAIVLKSVDRFVVRIDFRGLARPSIHETTPMELLTISAEEISNVSFSTIDLTEIPGYRPEEARAATST